MPKLNRKLVLAIAGYSAFFLVSFLLSAYLTFPYDRVRDLLVRRVAAQSEASGDPPAKLTIEEVGPNWLSGITLRGVTYERPAATKGEAPLKLAVDTLKVRASLLGLLRKRADVSFSAEIGDGDVSGVYETAEDEPTHLEMELDELGLSDLGLGGLLGVPIKGSASGTVDVTLADKPAGTQGRVELDMDDLTLGDGKAKVKLPGMAGGLTLETIHAGELELKVAIRDGIASIEQLDTKGKDLQLSGSGSIRVVRPFMQSRADITLGAKFADSYTKRNDRTKAAFDLMGNTPH